MERTVDRVIANLPQKLRAPVGLWFEHLATQDVDLPHNLVEPTARVVACSEFAGKVLLRELDWFIRHAASFREPVQDADLEAFVDGIATSDKDPAAIKSELRRYRNRYLLRVIWRELGRLADLDETLRQLSLLADRLLDAATRYATRQLRSRFGTVRNQVGDAVPLVVLGMGKLGGYELNFSSDIDLIFCYPDSGETDGERSIDAQEYFTRLSQQVIALIDEVTADGFVFRIDTRLRPFGDSGPPVVSFAALESYLLQHGRGWERYAYVKARIVGPKPTAAVAEELHSNMIRPFVYRRYLDYGVFESIREMQELVATEVRRRDLIDNVKLGPGGIREAEFIVQALQLVRGGREPALQSRELQRVLPKLVGDRGLSMADAEEISEAYRYLRRVENFIQAIRDQQTHDLPSGDLDRARLCLAMGSASWHELHGELERHRNAISRHFGAIALREEGHPNPRQQAFGQLWQSRASEEQWVDALIESTGDAAHTLANKIVAFASSSAVRKTDAVSSRRLRRFLPKLIVRIVESEQPVTALARTLAVSEQILRRSAYLSLLVENEQALSRLVDLCGRSQYIAAQIARYPALLDELLDPESYSEQLTKQDIGREARQKLDAEAGNDSEAQMQVISRFQRAVMFRIAVADCNDKLPVMKVSDGLTWLAEAVVEQALRVAWRDLIARHGAPCYVVDQTVFKAGFGIVGYGKLGGLELSYGSDLDIVFLHNSRGEKQRTDGDKPLQNSMFFARLARRLTHFLTTQTESGELYAVDTRLRPDGRSGLLVTSVEAFERYQEDNAWTWEHQALLRARAVAGSQSIAAEFERVRRETLSGRVRRGSLRADVISMRARMRKELDQSDATSFDLKHGQGGIGDIEFLVQYLVLREANVHPEVMRYSDNIRQLDALIAAGLLEESAATQLQDIYRRYRQYSHRLTLDGQKVQCEVGYFGVERDFVVSLWDDWLA